MKPFRIKEHPLLPLEPLRMEFTSKHKRRKSEDQAADRLAIAMGTGFLSGVFWTAVVALVVWRVIGR